uniref:Uncharacterized protein n=1 Tax=Glossina palpalis gambiensis TaxID=67801 RepID=A0A1B0B689_9MUSC
MNVMSVMLSLHSKLCLRSNAIKEIFHRLAVPYTQKAERIENEVFFLQDRQISNNSNKNERERDEMESYYNEKQITNNSGID